MNRNLEANKQSWKAVERPVPGGPGKTSDSPKASGAHPMKPWMQSFPLADR